MVQNTGLATEVTNKSMIILEKQLIENRKKLNALVFAQERQQKHRKKRKDQLEEVLDKFPETSSILNVQNKVGRRRLEDEQPNLLETIIEIINFGAGADERRRTEVIRSCTSLDDLTQKLRSLGYEISRSATYTRLIPHRCNYLEGRRHVKVVPVKLARAQESQHKLHSDTDFCVATIRALESLASFLGSSQVFFLPQDDKARVPIGITAANKQAKILMHLQYEISLPDHTWVKAARHKLIPSIYAGIIIKEGGFGDPSFVTYSGPTCAFIRSGKHDTSDASTHADDFSRVLASEIFQSLCKVKTEQDTDVKQIKPVVIMTSDGGPDENPRYSKVIRHAISHFKTYDLDALYIATNAPGRSAFNRVERRMAPLSHALSGVILDHEHYGSHLNSQAETTDPVKEKENFKHAGETLGEIWSTLTIDKHPVEAKFVESRQESVVLPEIDHSWFIKHVRSSQYALQIVKCDSRDCCTSLRSNLKMVLPSGFLPPPVLMKYASDGLQLAEVGEKTGKFLPLFTQIATKFSAPQKNIFTGVSKPFCFNFFNSTLLLKKFIFVADSL